MILYVCTQGARISIHDNQFMVSVPGEAEKSVPLGMTESVELFGNVLITTQAVSTCMYEKIPIIYYSYAGKYRGRVVSPGMMRPENIMRQYRFFENNELRMQFAKKIIEAKIHNQLVVLRRYLKDTNTEDVKMSLDRIKYMKKRIEKSSTIAQLMGFEGNAARQYFKLLGSIPEDSFSFEHRTRRPPLDPVNAALSTGYSILMSEICGKLEANGLMAEIGAVHSMSSERPSLACDLMEEWRPVIVDSTVIGMVIGKEFKEEDFVMTEGAVWLGKTGLGKLLRKMQTKMNSPCQYLKGTDNMQTFQQALSHQIYDFRNMLESENSEKYSPIKIR